MLDCDATSPAAWWRRKAEARSARGRGTGDAVSSVKCDPHRAGPGALVQFTPRFIGVLAGVVLVLGAGAVTIAARNGRDRVGEVLIHAVKVGDNGERVFVPPSPTAGP